MGKSLRIIAGSDLHGNLPSLPPADILLLGGDLFPWHNRDLGFQRVWQREVFRPWIDHQQCRYKIIVAGNHDFLWQEEPPRGRFCYLEDDGLEIEGWRIWGTPWTPPRAGSKKEWAFRDSEKKLAKKFSLVPRDTDILLSHSPAWGLLDWTGKRHAGSTAMLDTLRRVRPALFICGHIHESSGSMIWENTVLVNSAVRDRQRRSRALWSFRLSEEELFWSRGL